MKLKILRLMAIITGLIGTTLFNRFLEGGALFMSLILICLLTSIFFTKSLMNLKKSVEISKKMIKHINDSGSLGLGLGVMGSFIGLITAFDAIEATGGAEPSILAGGLKVALLSTLFGLFTYSISKLSVLVLSIIQK